MTGRMYRVGVGVALAVAVVLVAARLEAAGGITTPVICAGAPSACSYTIQSTSNIGIACSVVADGAENLNTPTATGVTFTQVFADVHNATAGFSWQCFTWTSTGTGAQTFSFSSQFGDGTYAVVAELTGTATSSFLDVNVSSGAASGTAMASGSFTTTATAILIGFGFDGGANTPTADAPWTKTTPAACTCLSDSRLILQYQLDQAAGSYNAQATKSLGAWFMHGFDIKLPAGGATPKPNRLTLLGVAED